MTTIQKYWAALAFVAVVQIGVLAKMALDRVALLKSGREIALQVLPVDPRDVMRGDYVILGYDMGRIKLSALTNREDAHNMVQGAPLYVTLQPDSDGGWKVAGAATSYPKSVDPAHVVIKGRLSFAPVFSDTTTERDYGVRYGIESYFVPEGTGRDLEAQVRDKKIQALLAVGKDGTAALKGLVIDGKRHEDPPLL